MSTVSKIQDAKATVASSAGDVDAFLAKVKTMPKASGEGRLVFAMDATMSRQPTWDSALSNVAIVTSCWVSGSFNYVTTCHTVIL